MIICYSSLNENDVFNAINSVIVPTDLINKTIFIKPNIRSAHKYEEGKNTSPFTLEKIIKYFKYNYNNKIIVSDSSIIGIDTMEAALVSGIYNVCKKYFVEFIDIKRNKFIEHKIEIPPYEIEITSIIENAYIVNVPKLKTTYAVPLSLSIKNLKGLLSDKSKKEFHKYGVNELLIELSKLVKSNISIIDADIALSLDTPINSKMIITTNGFEESDIYIAQKLGLNLNNIRYLDKINCNFQHSKIEEKYFNIRDCLKDIGLKSVVPAKYFKEKNINIIGKPCSGCMGCISKAIEKIKFTEAINIVTGFNNSNEKINKINNTFKTIAVGNCSSMYISNRVTGCPPMISEIINLLRERNI